MVCLVVLMGCQTPQMRELRKMGVLPEDISDRISRTGETPLGDTNHQPPVEETSPFAKPNVNVVPRGAEPEDPPAQTGPYQPNKTPNPPLGAPVSPPLPKSSVSVKPEGLGAAELEINGEKKSSPNPLDSIIKKMANPPGNAGPTKKIFETPTLQERATQFGHKHGGNRVVATVNGHAILEEEITLSMMMSSPSDAPTEQERRKQILNTLIDREIAICDADAKLNNGKIPQAKKFYEKMFEYGGKEHERFIRNIRDKNKMESDDEVRAMLKAQGLPIELIKRQTERNFVAMQYLQQRVMPATDRIGYRDLKEYYDQHKDIFTIPESIQWRDIFISKAKFNTVEEARTQAEMVAQKVRSGEDFVKLSRAYCHGDSALRDGEGYGKKVGEIKPPEAQPVILSLRDGEVAPILELGTGFHIIQLVKRQKAGQRPFDEVVQKEIRDRLKNERTNQEIKRLLNELRRQAIVEIMPES